MTPTTTPTLPPNALTRADIERGTCKRRGCDHSTHGPSVIRSQCHPRAPFEIAYYAGVLTVRCARCTQLVNRILVAAEPAPTTSAALVAKALTS